MAVAVRAGYPVNAGLRVATGCDLVHVSEVEASIRRYGPRYLRRVFGPTELAEAVREPGADPGPERLAARFAGKEALVKALGIGRSMGPWTELEVVRSATGGLRPECHGETASAIAALGVVSIDVSVAHDGPLAMATAVVLTVGGAPGPPRAVIREPLGETMSNDVTARIRTVLGETGGITTADTIGESANLYDAGLTSHASVNVMLALEDEFDVEFPDELLRKSTFGSIDAIAAALEEIGSE